MLKKIKKSGVHFAELNLLCLVASFALLMNCGVIGVMAVQTDESTYMEKLSSNTLSIMSDLDSKAKIPVSIWTNDIDQKTVEKEVEKEIGYGAKDLMVVDENLTDEMAQNIGKMDENVLNASLKSDFEEYYNRTAAARKIEKERTDAYILARREISRDYYEEKNQATINKAGLSEEEVLFVSRYSPMIIVQMAVEDIKVVAGRVDVKTIDIVEEHEVLPPPTTDEHLDNVKATNQIETIHTELGLRGTGVNIGLVDHGTYNITTKLPSSRFTVLGTPNYHDHARHCAEIVAGTNGIAPNAHVVTRFDGMDDIGFYTTVEALLDEGVTIITASRTQDYYTQPLTSYPQIAAWVDHVVSVHGVSFFAAVGNGPGWIPENGYNIIAPANADNVVSVVNYNNKGTASQTDDVMDDHCYDNGNQAMKPDLAAPTGDTSSATPFVAGIAALMMQLRPSLAAYPQAVKAILMASCQYKAMKFPGDTDPQENMGSGLTKKQGAGVMNPYLAICITGQGNYGVRTISGRGVTQSIHFKQPKYGATGLNVSLTWLRESTASIDHMGASAGTRWDLDLYLKQNGTTLTNGSSSNAVSSAEMVYVTPSSTNPDYTIDVKKYSSTSGTVRYAYAWSTNQNRFQYTQEFEGIHYIKNKLSGYYLDLNSDHIGTTQATFDDEVNQQWVVIKNGSYYNIQSAYNSIGKVGRGGLISGSYYKASIGSPNANVLIQNNEDGSVTFKQTISGMVYALGINEGSASVGAIVAWSPYSSVNEHQKWYFERLAYLRGDVNQDGVIDTTDSRLILQASVDKVQFNTVQMFLGDINGDGAVDTTDSRLVLDLAV